MCELILLNGDFRTQDPVHPRASAVAIAGGRIRAVSDNDEIRTRAHPDAEVIDLGGRLALPGLTDSHIHFYQWALRRQQLTLSNAGSLKEVLARITQAARETAPGAWVVGRGLDETRWPEGRLPTREELDATVPAQPVLLWRRDSHLAIANSRALELAGVKEDTADPPDGAIERDQSGQPTGVLFERAVDLVSSSLPKPSDEETVKAMGDAVPVMHKLGLTGLHDMRIWGGAEGQAALAAWQRFQQTGRMDIRCWMTLSGDLVDEAIDLGLKTGLGNDRLRLGHLKFFTDGSMGSRTAWVIEPYETGGFGMPVCSMVDLAEAIRRADQAGLAVAVHAIGDKANREVMTIFEDLAGRASISHLVKTARPCAPHRIEHAQILRPEDLARMSRLDVVASLQPLHITDEITIHDQALGARAKWAYAFRDMIDAGIRVTFGSDCPVSDPNPMWGIHAAVTRRQRDGTPEKGWYPHQTLTVPEAVRAYTMGAAVACGLEHELGSLTEGKLADLVVLDQDMYSIDPMAIHNVKVDLTIFDGQVVYQR